MSKVLTTAIGALLMAQAVSPALAQAWPSRPIRMIVPFAAGGSTDLTSRVTAEDLRPVLGQIVVVDNRPGANATIGADTWRSPRQTGTRSSWVAPRTSPT